jgi:hypothetical protein
LGTAPGPVPGPVFAEPALASAYEFCLLHAAIDDALPEELTKQWFLNIFDICADYVGLDWPPRRIRETVYMDQRGRIHLSGKPGTSVKFYRGPNLVAELPPDSPCLQGSPNNCAYDDSSLWRSQPSCCPPALCDCQGTPMTAVYETGTGVGCGNGANGAGGGLPPWFLQGVAHVFAWVCENRGDSEMHRPDLLHRCGAIDFLNRGIRWIW